MRSEISQGALRAIRDFWQRWAGRRITDVSSTAQQASGLRLVLIGVQDIALQKIRDFIGPAGGQVLLHVPLALHDEYPIIRAQPSHVVMDIESLGGISTAYAMIRRFRDRYPQVPVILISAEFAGDDLGTERLALCDVSLRVPFTFAALDLALREAATNNAAWQDRQATQTARA